MSKMMKKLNNKRGFTLIELIVVMAIIGILVMLAAPRFLGYTKNAHVASMKADAKVLSNAALIYNIEKEGVGVWPVTEEEVTDLPEGVTGTAKKLDKELLKNHIKNLKNPIDKYVLIVDDKDYEGEVIYFDGVEDRDGNTWYGIDIKVEKTENSEG